MEQVEVDFHRFHNGALMKVIGMPERMRGDGWLFTASNGIEIGSDRESELGDASISLWGRDESKDGTVSLMVFPTAIDAEVYLTEARKAIWEFNKHLAEQEAG